MTMARVQGSRGRQRAVMCASTRQHRGLGRGLLLPAPGIDCIVVLPIKYIAMGKLAQSVMHGAKVVAIEGNFDDALRIVVEITEQLPHQLVNSINPYRIEGQKTGAFEICDRLGDVPDYHAIPVGNAGNITAYWKGYKEYQAAGHSRRLPKMLGFQAAGAAPIVPGRADGRSADHRHGDQDRQPGELEERGSRGDESGGLIDAVTDDEILDAYKMLRERRGRVLRAGLGGVCRGRREALFARGTSYARCSPASRATPPSSASLPATASRTPTAPLRRPNDRSPSRQKPRRWQGCWGCGRQWRLGESPSPSSRRGRSAASDPRRIGGSSDLPHPGRRVRACSQMRERLAQVMAEAGAMLLVDARYRIRHAHGILQFEDHAEAERVAARFAELGFASFLLDELLPLPKPRLLGVGAQIPEEPVGLVALALLSTETRRVVADANQMDARVGYALFTGLGFEPQQDEVVTDRNTRYLMDLFTRDQHWRVQAGALPRIVDVFTALNVTDAHLSEGVHSLSQSDRRVPVFSDEKQHERYLLWLYQLRFAGQET